MFLKLTTDNGIAGYGEVYGVPFGPHRVTGLIEDVFERHVAAHPDCVPPDDRLFLGDIDTTVPVAARMLGAVAVLAHIDIGTGEKQASEALVRRIAPGLDMLLAPGAIVISDQPVPSWPALPPPDGVKPGRIHLYRRPGIGPSARGAKSVAPSTSR